VYANAVGERNTIGFGQRLVKLRAAVDVVVERNSMATAGSLVKSAQVVAEPGTALFVLIYAETAVPRQHGRMVERLPAACPCLASGQVSRQPALAWALHASRLAAQAETHR